MQKTVTNNSRHPTIQISIFYSKYVNRAFITRATQIFWTQTEIDTEILNMVSDMWYFRYMLWFYQ